MQDQSISVVIPSHQRPVLLERLLNSLKEQDYPHEKIEILVIPTENDPGIAVAQQMAKEMRIPLTCRSIPNDPTGGRSAAAKRNYGVTLAQHSWIAFIDDDCVATPDWLSAASQYFNQAEAGAIEGLVEIPPVDPPTLTYKGIRRLSRAQGYQTCNMFYRKETFLEVGGFDLRFPFYLEDTDLAWSVLDRGHRILFVKEAVIQHPVPPAEPWRLLADAKRTKLLVYLKSKHPQLYRDSHFRVMKRSYFPYLALYGLSTMGLLSLQAQWIVVGLVGLALLSLVHSVKLFRGCRFTWNEWWVTTLLLALTPPISLFQWFNGLWTFRQKNR